MDRLILMRHGKAEARPPAGEAGDYARRLTPAGVEAAAEAGRRLAAAGVVPDRVLVSGAARTRQTWAAAGAAFPEVAAEFDDRLFHAEAEVVLDAAQAAQARSVMVVGHNPGLHALAARLLARDPAPSAEAAKIASGFPTSAIAVFRFNPDRSITVEQAVLRDEA